MSGSRASASTRKWRTGTGLVAAISVAVLLTGCGAGNMQAADGDRNRPLIVTTSSLVADFVSRVAGDTAEVVTLVPNGFDAHTYEPKPSELAQLEDADLVVLADKNLNAAITGLVSLSGDSSRILDLNGSALQGNDFIYRESGNAASANPHTWTSPVLAARWVDPITERLVDLVPGSQETIEMNAAALTAELVKLDANLREAFKPLSGSKMVVYHDAWEYFGREYGIEVVGALQAVNFAEPSAAELAAMSEQIRSEGVRAFFGSEVFPSDVLEALEAESGARYIPDLADDRLPGVAGAKGHSYVAMMEANLVLLLEGLRT